MARSWSGAARLRPPTLPSRIATDPDKLVDLALEIMDGGDLERAREILERAHDTDPTHLRALYELGAVHHALGEIPEAAAYFQQGLGIDDGDAHLHTALALELAEMGMLNEALEHATMACGLEPEASHHQARRAEILGRLARLDEAVAVARRAVELDRGDSHAARILADLLMAAERWREASEVLIDLLERGEDLHLRIDLADALDSIGDDEGAEAQLSLAADLADPESYDDQFAVGTGLGRAGQGAAAIPFLERATAIDASRSRAWANLSAAYLADERWGEAQRAAERALEIDPSDAIALCNLGDAHAGRGAWREAERAFTRAVMVDVDGETAARERLAEARRKLGGAPGR